MFRRVKWRIAGAFLGLSGLVYVLLSISGVLFFYLSGTSFLDEQLRLLMSELGHAIDLRQDKPVFRDWLRHVQTKPSRSLVTIQLYDTDGKLLDSYGPPAIERLFLSTTETNEGGRQLRLRYSRLVTDGKLRGYLQLEIPTAYRDAAVQGAINTVGILAPFLLIGLAMISYLVADRATRPIETTMAMLRRFIADAGHELNTPLSIVQARAESLERKLTRLGHATEDVKFISTAAERMGNILNDLTLLAEMEEPMNEPKGELVDIANLVADVADEFSLKFDQKGIALVTQAAPSVTILGDRHTLERMLGNLIENALRYTDPGGSVTLAVNQTGSTVRLSVKDTGIGIPEESLPRIFDRFYRVDKSRSRESGGTGLGLSIVKAIIDAHKGTVEVESVQGKGTEFAVKLPICLSPLRDARHA